MRRFASTLRLIALAATALASLGCGGGSPSGSPKTTSAGAVPPSPTLATAACRACGDGAASPALLASLKARSADAKECFRRELQTSEATGNMQVRLEIGSDGSVCGATTEVDTTGSTALRSCVVDLLEKTFYPPPEEGCVVVSIPFSFAIAEGKTEDCGRLVGWINKGVDSIGAGGPGAPKEGAEALDALAATMDSVADEAAKIHLTTEELRAYAVAYAEMARDIAQAARLLATADRNKDDARKGAAQAALQAAVKREDPIVDSINRACKSP